MMSEAQGGGRDEQGLLHSSIYIILYMVIVDNISITVQPS